MKRLGRGGNSESALDVLKNLLSYRHFYFGRSGLDTANPALWETVAEMEPKFDSETLTVPAKLYRIGELVGYTPFSRQTIHNYTIMGLIREAKWTAGGHRLYDESVFERLSEIIKLRKTKTLVEIREILMKKDARGSQPAGMTQQGTG